MPYVGGDVAGRGIDALDTVTNSTEPSSGRQIMLKYLASKGLPATGENMRRGFDANARDPGTIPNLVNNAPSTDAEDFAAGARGPASPGYGGPTNQTMVGRSAPSGGSSARDIVRGQPTVQPSASPTEPTAANGVATAPGAPTPDSGSGLNWPLILGLAGGAAGGAGLTYGATRGGGTAGAPTASAEPPPIPPRAGESLTAPTDPIQRQMEMLFTNPGEPPPIPPRPGAALVQPGATTSAAPSESPIVSSTAREPPAPRPSAAQTYANRPQQAGPPGTAARAAPPAEPFIPPLPGDSMATRYANRPGAPPPQAPPVVAPPPPSSAVNMDEIIARSMPQFGPPPPPGSATISPNAAKPDQLTAQLAEQRATRPMPEAPTSPTRSNAAAASDPARIQQLQGQTGTSISDAAKAKILALQAARARAPIRIPSPRF